MNANSVLRYVVVLRNKSEIIVPASNFAKRFGSRQSALLRTEIFMEWVDLKWISRALEILMMIIITAAASLLTFSAKNSFPLNIFLLNLSSRCPKGPIFLRRTDVFWEKAGTVAQGTFRGADTRREINANPKEGDPDIFKWLVVDRMALMLF